MNKSIGLSHFSGRILVLLIIVLFLGLYLSAQVSLDDMEKYWLHSHGEELVVDEDFFGTMMLRLLAKADPDECFYGIGDPRNFYNPYLMLPCDADARPKTNQAYVWGLTQSGHDLWFGTAPNVHCLVLGGYLQFTIPLMTNSWVCEFGDSSFSPPLPDFIGDWRPPRIFLYNTEYETFTDKTGHIPYPDSMLLATTAGIRSAGTLGDVVLLGGPNLLGGINLFAFRASTKRFLGSVNLPQYNNIRKWLVVNDVLYTTVGSGVAGVNEAGKVLRWRGSLSHPFLFEEVGDLPSQGAELAFHEGRIFVTTWPDTTLIHTAGLYMSPVVPKYGLSSSHAGLWQKVWDVQNYEPDPVTAHTYGGGALASFDGYLYWGTMHVPGMSLLAHIATYGPPSDIYGAVMAVLGTWRAIKIFRGRNFGTFPHVELVYGMPLMPAYIPGPGWMIVPNNMGCARPLYGPSGFGNFFNNYTWTMRVYRDYLYVGTMDCSYLFFDMIYSILFPYVENIPRDSFDFLPCFLGADLFYFSSSDHCACPISINGLGNYTNYGFRTMITDQDALYIGSANPMNLHPYGGWELILLAKYSSCFHDGESSQTENTPDRPPKIR